jgi:SAM-dependent methyltransferase
MNESTTMDLGIIREINLLWMPVYSSLCKQAAEHCHTPPPEILEIGCFSGGIGLGLLNMFPESRLTVVMPETELTESFEDDWKAIIDKSTRGRFRTAASSLNSLNLDSDTFDLVISRGVFFFLDSYGALLSEIGRVLATDGIAFVGGGFGSHTSPQAIDSIADESRRLNYALGKRIFSRDEFQSLLETAGLQGRFNIVEDGGLWAVISSL